MGEIELSRASIKRLDGAENFEAYYPSIDNITSIADFDRFRLENMASELFRERIYVVIVNLIKSNKWKNISTIKTICYSCGTISQTHQLKDINSFYSEEGNMVCPVCGSEDVVYESVAAFETIEDFYKWVQQELGKTKRTILMRREFLDKAERLGVSEPVAFAGLVKWGVDWMRFARSIEAAVIKGSMEVEEAQNLMSNYDAIPDKSSIKRFINTMAEVDDIELVGVPFSSDFIMNIITPEGEIKYSTYYAGIPIKDEGVVVNQSRWWDSNIGLMVARRLKINAPITYESGLKLVPNYNFYKLSYYRTMLIQPIKNTIKFLLKRADRIDIPIDDVEANVLRATIDKVEKTGPLASIRYTIESIRKIIRGREFNYFNNFTRKLHNETDYDKSMEYDEEFDDEVGFDN